jgi:hypothetical protein
VVAKRQMTPNHTSLFFIGSPPLLSSTGSTVLARRTGPIRSAAFGAFTAEVRESLTSE